MQVNGGGGALFNDDPAVETIRTIARAHRRFGTTSLLPTLITDDTRKIARAIEAARAALAQRIPGVIGIHIEGPCLNEMLQGRRIDVREGRCVDANGTRSGSDLDMATAVRNAVSMLDVTIEDAIRMASTWPAEFLGLGHEIGRIAPGYRANLVLADPSMQVLQTWIDGEVG